MADFVCRRPFRKPAPAGMTDDQRRGFRAWVPAATMDELLDSLDHKSWVLRVPSCPLTHLKLDHPTDLPFLRAEIIRRVRDEHGGRYVPANGRTVVLSDGETFRVTLP